MFKEAPPCCGPRSPNHTGHTFARVGGPPQPAGDMLGAGGTCEFSAQTLRSDRRGAHVSPASARASDPAAPPSGIAPASDDAASPMRTEKTHRLATCVSFRFALHSGLPMPRRRTFTAGILPILFGTADAGRVDLHLAWLGAPP